MGIERYLTDAEYARHRGVSVEDIHAARRKGRIAPASITPHPNGQMIYRFDPAICDLDWDRNADESDKAKKPKGKKQASDATKTQTPKQVPVFSGNRAVPKALKQFAQGGSSTQEEKTLRERAERAKTEKLEAEALEARIKVEVLAKQLVNASEVEDVFASMISMARDHLQNRAEELKAEFPSIDPAILIFLKKRDMDIFRSLVVPDRDSIHVENRIESVYTPIAGF